MFDLRVEPWIPVIRTDGTVDEVGLESALTEAHAVSHLVGESPTQTASLLRLLLVVLHRVFGPADGDAWAELYRADRFPTSPIREYLAGQKEAFDLLDPKRPFCQCAAVAGAPNTDSSKLVPALAGGNNALLFDHTTPGNAATFTAAQAARWLVTLQTYDVGGMKTAAPGGKDRSSRLAPGNMFSFVVASGGSLWETLMLNLIPYNPKAEQPYQTTGEDRPVWERPPPQPEPQERFPIGYLDYLTWQSRRVLLIADEDDRALVTGVIVTPGDKFPASLEYAEVEPLAAFTRNPNAKATETAWPALRMREDRALWRNSTALLATTDNVKRPRNLDWLGRYAYDGILDPELRLDIQAFGQRTDRNGGAVQFWRSEHVTFPLPLLSEDHAPLVGLIERAITLADDIAKEVRWCEREWWRSMGEDPPNSRADWPMWASLYPPFTSFLDALARSEPDDNAATEAAATGWEVAVVRSARDAYGTLVDRSSLTARGLASISEIGGRFEYRIAVHRGAWQTQVEEAA
ncbi:MAG: type I-E CRISPR-associated protein Cse1/CasA [bacterium]|nr:type I-E CRISPR-associated protein Cse1/CasA [bacterium]